MKNALKTLLMALLMSIAAMGFAPLLEANSFTQSKSASTSTSQYGQYRLWGYGNYHGWSQLPSPNPYGDGYNYAEWTLTYDLSRLPRKISVTSAMINASWTINAPTVYPAVISYPTRGPGSSRQPIKYMSPAVAGWLTRIVFNDGYTYWFPGPPRQNPNSINLVGLGLGSHLENSTQVTLVGTLQYNLGRAYLDDAAGDDWQHAHGWAEWCVNGAYGAATATGSGTLSVNFTPPCDPPVITSQPKNTTVLSGQPATFS